MSKGRFFSILLAFILIGLFLRTFEISIRPFHSDEGVNYLFLKQIGEKGYYPYSHENYHGPSFFYSAYLSLKVFGHNDFGMRAASIFYGMLCLLLLIFFSGRESRTFSVVALALFALSSSLIFHSRYAIHETLFVFSTLWVFFHLYSWCSAHRARDLYGLSLALAVLIATKETFVINLSCLALVCLAFGDIRLHLRELSKQREHLQYGFILGLIVIFAFFTGGFQWFPGIREMFMAVQQWVGRGVEIDTGHFKPFLYYTKDVIFKAEPHLLLALFISLVVALNVLIASSFSLIPKARIRFSSYLQFVFSKNLRLLRALSFWSLGVCLVYSLVPYKTVWLIINLTLPLLLVLATFLALLVESCNRRRKILGIMLFFVVLVSSLFHAYRYNFKIPYGSENPYSYVHTSAGMLEMIGDIEAYWKDKNPKASVLIGVNSYWPLPYYFRARKSGLGYLKTTEPEKYAKEYQVIIVDYTVHWDNKDWEKKYYRLSDVQEANVYYLRVDGTTVVRQQ